jgi:hypothetical protein
VSKRSNFERVERDFYPTPREAVLPLAPFLRDLDELYVEPCAGDGSLVRHIGALTDNMVCGYASDIEPMADGIHRLDALNARWGAELHITNPPWDRKILHPLIERLTENGGRAWLLFDADWCHTKQAIPYLPRLRKIVSVGRVKWIPDSKMTGKDNCCWYYFTEPSDEPTIFYGRQ